MYNLYNWNPHAPTFGQLTFHFLGQNLQNQGHWGSRYDFNSFLYPLQPLLQPGISSIHRHKLDNVPSEIRKR